MKKKTPGHATSKKTDARHKIVQALLQQVAFDGWTETAYAAALKQAHMTRAEADKHFPGGLADCVEYFAVSVDEGMQERIKAERNFARMRVRDKITFAVRARLEIMLPHREAVRRLMLWYAMPLHMPSGARRFYRAVDMIWVAAGDTSTDYNFYTKRVLLSAVLKATILFWLGDETPGCSATWDFLDRRIGDVMKLGKTIGLLKEFKPSELADMLRDRLRNAI